MNEKEAHALKKPTLLSIRKRTDITTEQLALAAGVTLSQAYTVEIGGFVHTDVAQKVIKAFVQLSGIYYTLDDIRLHNVPRTQPKDHTRYKEWRVQ